jgi:hypothetical protein
MPTTVESVYPFRNAKNRSGFLREAVPFNSVIEPKSSDTRQTA